MKQPQTKSPFEFTGGHLCLDFTNTVNSRGGEQPEELFTSYDRLLQWAAEAHAVAAKTLSRLGALAKASPARAESTLRQAVQLRDALYDIFQAVAQRRAVPEGPLAVLNRAVQRAAEYSRLTGQQRFRWEWVNSDTHLDSILWVIARSASELLTSDEITMVGQCASTRCAWLFLDTTKNHRRRWCDMRICGNRDKARRYYERTRAAG